MGVHKYIEYEMPKKKLLRKCHEQWIPIQNVKSQNVKFSEQKATIFLNEITKNSKNLDRLFHYFEIGCNTAHRKNRRASFCVLSLGNYCNLSYVIYCIRIRALRQQRLNVFFN